MPDYDAGTASVRIRPRMDRFQEDLEAELKKVKATAYVQIEAQTGQARADIDRFRDQESRKGLNLGVDADVAGAEAKLEAFRASQRDKGIKFSVDADTKSAERDVDSLAKKLADIGPGPGGGALKFNFALVGISELPAAAVAVATLTDALQDLAGAGLAIPGIMGGIGASVGTLALGLDGVTGAFQAYNAANNDSVQLQQQVTAQAHEAASAQDALRNAVTDQKHAQEDLSKAYKSSRQELEDLNVQVRGGQLDQREAVLDAQKARQDLATGHYKTALDYEQAQLRVEQADQRVAEATQRGIDLQNKVNDANAKGVEGSDQVVAAHDRLTRANQAVTDASNRATDAASKAAAPDKAAQALAKLAPNAQAFVKAIQDLRPAYTDLQQTVQDDLFANLDVDVKTLANDDLPLLKTGLGGIATAINGDIRQAFASLGSGQSQGLLTRILGNTGDADARLKAAIDPIIHAVEVLTAAGSDALPGIADSIDRIATRFDNFISAADADGSLKRWIDQGLEGFGHIGETLVNLVTAFSGINKAAGGGEGLLGTIETLSKRFADWTNSVAGQNKLKEYFEEGRQIIRDDVIPLLQSLPGFLDGVAKAGKTIADELVPPLKDVATFLGKHKELIADVVIAFGTWKTITGVASLITDLQKITDLLGSGGAKGEKGKGGRGIMGKLAMITIAGVALDQLINDDTDPNTPPPSAASSLGSAAANIGSDAALGAQAAGIPGAVAGAALGAGESVYNRVAGDVARGQQNEKQLFDDYAKNHPYVAPTTNAPSPQDELRAKIAAGQLPGYSLAPDGTIIGPDGKPMAIGTGHSDGGVLPGYSPGRDNMWVPMAGGEGVLKPDVTRKLGPRFINALNHGFADGGVVPLDFTHPIGPLPGPAAPPAAAGAPAFDSFTSAFTSGLSGTLPFGIGGFLGGQGAGQMPHIGLDPKLAAGDPDAVKAATEYLKSSAGDFLGKAVGIGYNGILSGLGLDNSILSPNNAYNQAIGKVVDWAHGGNDGSDLGVGSQSITVGDGSQIQIPTYGTSITPTGADGKPLGVGALAGIQYAQTHALGQKYVYGGVGATNAAGTPGYDCSGIASAVYAASKGLPEGKRYFTTESDFPALGFLPGFQAGALNVGIMRGGGGPNSHMALTLPNGVNVESGGASDSTQYGGSAAGALSKEFPIHYYLPLPGGIPQGFAAGGPTPGTSGPLADGGYPAVVHKDEFMISARGRATVPDWFLHRLNEGQLRGFALGGDIADILTPTPPPKPNFNVPDIKPITAAAPTQGPSVPVRHLPAAVQPPPDTTPPESAAAGTAPPQQRQSAVPVPVIGAPPSSNDHELPALKQGITSGAAAIGNAAATAASVASFGAGGGGGIGGEIQGLATVAGKAVNDVANVFSSFGLGTVDKLGSTDRAYGYTAIPQQQQPDVLPYGGPRTVVGGIYGHNTDDVFRQLDVREARDRQGFYANR